MLLMCPVTHVNITFSTHQLPNAAPTYCGFLPCRTRAEHYTCCCTHDTVQKWLSCFYVFHNSLLITNLTHFFQCLYLFPFSTCFERPCAHHQENQIVSIHHLVLSLCVGDCLVCWSGTPSSPAYQAVTYTEWYIPDDVLIQLILLMMSTGLLETCREVK